MNIIEATEKALEEHKCIYQTDYPDVKMEPDLCLPFDIMMKDGSKRTHCWNPTGGDILSDDWEICD